MSDAFSKNDENEYFLYLQKRSKEILLLKLFIFL